MGEPIAFERAAVVVAKTLASFRLGLDAADPFAYTDNEFLEAGHIVGRLWAENLLNTAGEEWVRVGSENEQNALDDDKLEMGEDLRPTVLIKGE